MEYTQKNHNLHMFYKAFHEWTHFLCWSLNVRKKLFDKKRVITQNMWQNCQLTFSF